MFAILRQDLSQTLTTEAPRHAGLRGSQRLFTIRQRQSQDLTKDLTPTPRPIRAEGVLVATDAPDKGRGGQGQRGSSRRLR